ncbi:putative WD40 repeat protein [Trypanosoma equiperdum]|uniref:Predicted WD40 repeat protein n=1 Tax=Trypanosoma equiperdum TaxID=5694 RepID=A0A1G4IIV5_TRYEQ|nr:predicted WD40 repeat protein [Trypanosoma equiperdum]
MRHWAQAEYDSTASEFRSKRHAQLCSGTPLQKLSTNNPRMMSRSPVEDETPPVRLSRHIPQREGMDMVVSAYNLTTSPTPPLVLSPGVGASGVLSLPHSAGASFSSHFSESIVSDDSSYVTSMYNEVLAEQLSSESTQKQRKIGGEVLGFNNADSLRSLVAPNLASSGGGRTISGSVSPTEDDGPKHCEYSANTNSTRTAVAPLFAHAPTGRAMLLKKIKPGKAPTQRVMFTTPERTLDAPEFPSDVSQLLHWGTNNKLIIGLKNGLHGWDAETAKASQIVCLEEHATIRAVHWLDGCTCVALALDEGPVAIYDCHQVGFLRTLQTCLSGKARPSYIAANGPLLSVGLNSGTGGVYVFDLRTKNALISVYEGHANGVASLNYCTKEPFYLAAGYANGAVRVWDARRANCPRYVFDSVHSGPVTAIHWDPDKRSKMYTGGQDGMMCYVDTNAPTTNVPSAPRTEDEGFTGGCHFITRAINTMHPISGIVAPPDVGELATTHRGKGQIQLRQSSNLHLIGALGSPNTSSDITCPTIAPDMQRICTAQDELLKFWRVFWPGVSPQRAECSTPPPVSLLEDELR